MQQEGLPWFITFIVSAVILGVFLVLAAMIAVLLAS